MDTAARSGIVYLSDNGSDPFTAVRTSIRNLAAWAEGQGAMYVQGAFGSRPAAGKPGRFFKATGSLGDGVLHYDNGVDWETVGASAATDAAANVGSLRTLGGGALQAAAGNHTHGIGAILGAGTAASRDVGSTAGTVADGGALDDLLILTIAGAY